jgi:hypothetical protein
VEKNSRKNGMEPFERLFEAHLRLADMTTNPDSDRAYERAKDNFRKAAVNYAEQLRLDAVKHAQELAWKRGKQKGRPRKRGAVSRWTRWRRSKFAALFRGAHRSQKARHMHR